MQQLPQEFICTQDLKRHRCPRDVTKRQNSQTTELTDKMESDVS